MTLTQITEKGIKDGEILNADINASAAIAGSKIDPSFTSNITVSGTDPRIIFTDTNNNPDFTLHANGGEMQVENSGSGTQVKLESSGSTRVYGNLIANANLTVDTNTLHVDSSNNQVGIGTTSPATALEVKDSADSRITITAGNAISQAGINFSDNSGVDGIVTFDHNTRKLHLGAGTSSFTDGDITINSSGNVGIGTASPSKKLDVSGDLHVSAQILNERGTASAPPFSFTDDTDTGIFNISNADLGFSVGGIERMRIESGGHTRFGPSGAGSDSAWSDSTYGNTEVAIDGGGGYGVLHFRGDGAGSTNTRFSMGVGDDKFYMAYDDVDNAHRMVVNGSGIVSIPQGIELGSGTDGTPAGNILDDYEEGTWTPSVQSGGGSLSTYVATYTKIGRLVHIQCYVSYTTANSSNAFMIGGLPFACAGNNYEVNVVDFGAGGKEGAYCRTHTGNSYMEFLYSSGSPSVNRYPLRGNHIGNGYIILSNTYITA